MSKKRGNKKKGNKKNTSKKRQKKHVPPRDVVIDDPALTPEQNLLRRLPAYKQPKKAHKFREHVSNSWQSVYFVARGRPTTDNKLNIVNLGTGFLCSPRKFMTCSHVINNPKDLKNPLSQHKDGDVYFLVSRNGSNENYHKASVPNLKLNDGIKLYPKLDTAIIDLPDSFYTDGKKVVYKDPQQYLRLSKDKAEIGQEVGVIGYPFQELKAANNNLQHNSIYIRADKGVINTGYTQASDKLDVYETTMPFNPGNSGGPVIDLETGKVVAIVHGFSSNEMHIEVNGKKNTVFAHYSIGISTTNFNNIAENNDIKLF